MEEEEDSGNSSQGDLKQKIIELEGRCENLAEELEQQKQANKLKEQGVSNTAEEFEDKVAELMQMHQEKMKEMEGEIEAKKLQIQQLKDTLDEYESVTSSYRNNNNNNSRSRVEENNKEEEEDEEVQKKIEEMEKRVQELEELLKKAEEEKEELREKCDEQVEDIMCEMTELQSQNREYRKQQDQMMKEKQNEIEKKEKEITQKQEHIEQQNSALKEKETQIQDLSQRLDDTKQNRFQEDLDDSFVKNLDNLIDENNNKNEVSFSNNSNMPPPPLQRKNSKQQQQFQTPQKTIQQISPIGSESQKKCEIPPFQQKQQEEEQVVEGKSPQFENQLKQNDSLFEPIESILSMLCNGKDVQVKVKKLEASQKIKDLLRELNEKIQDIQLMKEQLVQTGDNKGELEKLEKENKLLQIELMARNKKLKEWKVAYQQPLIKKNQEHKNAEMKSDDYYVHNQTKIKIDHNEFDSARGTKPEDHNLEDLVEQINEYKDEIEEYLDQISAYKEDNIQVRAQNEALQQEIQEHEAEEDRYMKQQQILKEEMAKLKQELAENSAFQIKGTLKAVFPKLINAFCTQDKTKQSTEVNQYINLFSNMLNLDEKERLEVIANAGRIGSLRKSGWF